MLTVRQFDHLPPEAEHLLPRLPFDRSAAWFRAVADTAVSPESRPFYLVVSKDGRPVSVWPLLAAHGRAGSLTCPYTCHYAPASADAAAAREAGRALRRWGAVRLEALDGDLHALKAGLRAAGLLVLPYAHFGNWHEPAADWPAYLAARPGSLREVIRRRLRAVTDGRLQPEFTDTDGALDAYETVYRRSWKTPEPFPAFAPRFLREAAAAGILRMAVLRHDGQPVAAQYWTVEDGVATVLKLAHDESLKQLSPGTVLTAVMIRRLFERDGIGEIDFGRGDDVYKQLWASQRRQRIGWLLANPLHPVGLAAAVRHVAGRVAAARPGRPARRAAAASN